MKEKSVLLAIFGVIATIAVVLLLTKLSATDNASQFFTFCSDSDGGLNYFNKGHTWSSEGSTYAVDDRCVNRFWNVQKHTYEFQPTINCANLDCFIEEEYCTPSTKKVAVQRYQCNCKDGKCSH